jgi:hypothetical protein
MAAVPPDATFSLRIADGAVRGYEYNGTLAPTHTTFHGLYDRHRSFSPMYRDQSENPWRLPQRWQTPPAGLDLGTALNFVSTADIIGGNSGSPVLDRELRVVGLVFDGNIESLPGDYIYLPERNRTVAVDARGILEALDDYDMDRPVVERLPWLPHGGGGDRCGVSRATLSRTTSPDVERRGPRAPPTTGILAMRAAVRHVAVRAVDRQ